MRILRDRIEARCLRMSGREPNRVVRCREAELRDLDARAARGTFDARSPIEFVSGNVLATLWAEELELTHGGGRLHNSVR